MSRTDARAPHMLWTPQGNKHALCRMNQDMRVKGRDKVCAGGKVCKPASDMLDGLTMSHWPSMPGAATHSAELLWSQRLRRFSPTLPAGSGATGCGTPDALVGLSDSAATALANSSARFLCSAMFCMPGTTASARSLSKGWPATQQPSLLRQCCNRGRGPCRTLCKALLAFARRA